MDFRIPLFRIINISKLWDTSRLTKFKRIISYSVNLAHLWVDFRTFFHLFCNDFPMFFFHFFLCFSPFFSILPLPKVSPIFAPVFPVFLVFLSNSHSLLMSLMCIEYTSRSFQQLREYGTLQERIAHNSAAWHSCGKANLLSLFFSNWDLIRVRLNRKCSPKKEKQMLA